MSVVWAVVDWTLELVNLGVLLLLLGSAYAAWREARRRKRLP